MITTKTKQEKMQQKSKQLSCSLRVCVHFHPSISACTIITMTTMTTTTTPTTTTNVMRKYWRSIVNTFGSLSYPLRAFTSCTPEYEKHIARCTRSSPSTSQPQHYFQDFRYIYMYSFLSTFLLFFVVSRSFFHCWFAILYA